MTTLLWVIVGAIIFYLVLSIVKGKREHKLKLRMKQFGNGMVGIGGLALCMYTVVLAMAFLPAVIKVTDYMLILNATYPDTVAVLRAMPIAFAVLTGVFAIWFLNKAYRLRPFRYTGEEREIVDAEKQKTREWFGKVFRVFRFRRKNGHKNKH